MANKKKKEQQLSKLSTPQKNGEKPAENAIPPKGNEEKGEKKAEHIVVQHGFIPNNEGRPMSESHKLAFLDYFNDFLTPSHTCQAIDISLRVFYDWLDKDPAFKKAFHIVNRFLIDRYARMATSRAFRGSDNLLMFMLKANDPMYRDKVQAELDPKMIEAMAKNIVNALRRSISDTCPHCKTNLGLSGKVEVMLKNLGKGLPT